MSTIAHTLQEHIQQFHKEEISFAHLMRFLVAYNHWNLPSKEGEPFIQQYGDKQFVSLYSTPENCMAEAWQDAKTTPLEKNGYWIVDNLPDVDGIVIDANQPHAMQIPRNYFSYLLQYKEALQLEDQLYRDAKAMNFSPELLAMMQQFPYYVLAIVQDPHGMTHITLAPDNQNRKLAAVFTTIDCFEKFAGSAKELLGDIRMDILSGPELFTKLAELPLDGMVVNCYGPGYMTAFGAEFMKQLIQSPS